MTGGRSPVRQGNTKVSYTVASRVAHPLTVTGKPSLVSVVDDDESVRESLPDMLRQFGFAAQAFSSAEAFLASDVVSETSCLLLDIAMPGMSGPDLQQELKRRRLGDPDCLHHRARGRVGAPTAARARRGRVPVQAVQ